MKDMSAPEPRHRSRLKKRRVDESSETKENLYHKIKTKDRGVKEDEKMDEDIDQPAQNVPKNSEYCESMKCMIRDLNTSLGDNTKIQEIHENFEYLRNYVTVNMNDEENVPVNERSLFEDYLRTFNKVLKILNPKDKKNFKRIAQEAVQALQEDQDRFNQKKSVANFKFR